MKQYKTIDIARRIGIHVNTVRLYEKCALIPKPERLPNGYRVFTDLHIEQFKLARAALRVEVLQNGLRKQAVNIIKVSVIGNPGKPRNPHETGGSGSWSQPIYNTFTTFAKTGRALICHPTGSKTPYRDAIPHTAFFHCPHQDQSNGGILHGEPRRAGAWSSHRGIPERAKQVRICRERA